MRYCVAAITCLVAAHSTAGDTKSTLTFRSVASIASTVSARKNVLIVGFEPRMEKRAIDGAEIPYTRFEGTLSGEGQFVVDGTFTLTKRLSGSLPKLGAAQGALAVNLYFRDTDLNARRLSPFLDPENTSKRTLLLAIGDSQQADVLQYWFVGPLSDADMADLPNVIDALREKEFAEASVADASRWLESHNSLLRLFGAVRLQQLNLKPSKVLLQAAYRARPEHVELIAKQWLLWCTAGEPFATDAGMCLVRFLQDAEPAQQNAFLKKVNELIGESGSYADALAKLESLEATLVDLEKRRASDKAWEVTVDQYRALRDGLHGRKLPSKTSPPRR